MDPLVFGRPGSANAECPSHRGRHVDLPDHDALLFDRVVDAAVAYAREIDDLPQASGVRVGAHVLQLLDRHQIGRASCRERVSTSEMARSVARYKIRAVSTEPY